MCVKPGEVHKIVISGDALHHPCQIAHADWVTYYVYDQVQVAETRKKLIERIKMTKHFWQGRIFLYILWALLKEETMDYFPDEEIISRVSLK